jgi:ring-1,2-phenylacetyl-CoA epoxidase subunit PaaC
MTTEHDNPYDLLADTSDEGHRWAFGTGFYDPLEGMDTSVPAGLEAGALAAYCLGLGDDALVYSHRLQEWLTRMPELEEETALANIALDLLGQARMLLSRAGGILGRGEDELAFFRTEPEFRNVRFVERLDGDFAELAGRLLIFSAWRLELFTTLAGVADPVLAAIAAKGVKELTYHRDWAAQWVIRLGAGTDYSAQRMAAALTVIWPLVDELFRPDPSGFPVASRDAVNEVLDTVFAAGRLERPSVAPLATVSGRAGREGLHTEALGYLLAELQSIARANPDATW